MNILDELNEEQKKPVLDTEGAVLVLAGAGSGKTRVLTARISHLAGDLGVPPENVLAITFTNKAASEMKARLETVTDIRRMWVCTIHSMCVRILRMYAGSRGLNENFSIYSEQERSAVVKQAFKECGYEDNDGLLKAVKYHISEAKMQGLTPDAYAKAHARERNIDAAVAVYRKYCAHLKAYNALDFDDLLTEARELLACDKEAREYLAGKFRYIHVDEFQDTNAVQFDIVKMLASEHGNLFAVGDDDQSIYGWRGAKIENILHFERVYPRAKIYKLQRNYRSTKAILSLANASISNNALRKGKELWTENEEGEKPVYYAADEEIG
ncbi:MAG: UvrD-helicase domain-containing protein [Clostridia bacterium]|nr:UvrD-helicase domain-containing protein [Clostridia bacterium]